jgi:RimJ/RimL family protein N-acetyltransferase
MSQVTVREAQPGDAQALLAFVRGTLAEPGLDVPLQADEFDLSVEEEERILADCAASQNSIMLLAEVGQSIVGQLGLRGGGRRALRHAAELGMMVSREWRGQGIGFALMERAIAWARDTGVLKRIELKVYVRNSAALHLYHKFGFRVEGRRQRAVRQDGEWLDDYIMALLL